MSVLVFDSLENSPLTGQALVAACPLITHFLAHVNLHVLLPSNE